MVFGGAIELIIRSSRGRYRSRAEILQPIGCEERPIAGIGAYLRCQVAPKNPPEHARTSRRVGTQDQRPIGRQGLA
jgi:hypothetical protein